MGKYSPRLKHDEGGRERESGEAIPKINDHLKVRRLFERMKKTRMSSSRRRRKNWEGLF
jgi:hypothetical protein